MRKISVIHPTRGRREIARAVYKKTLYSAFNVANIEYLLSVDEDENTDYTFGKVIRGKNYSAISAINNAARQATGDILIVISDDFELPNHWDKMILDATANKTDWLLKVNDGTQGWIITIPIMDRVFYNRFGFIYYPSYQHMFCDTDLASVGDLMNKTITRNDIIFKHNHYSIVGGKDAINDKNDRTWDQGEAVYFSRFVNNFDVAKPVGSIRWQPHLKWIESKKQKYGL